MKLLYHAHMWPGSTALQRCEAFARLPGVTTIASDIGSMLGDKLSLVARLRWRLRWPMDADRENAKLIAAVVAHRPDVVFIDNSRVITRSTLLHVRQLCDPTLIYYSPDDIIAPHNLSWPLRLTFPEWDIVFTTKTFNVEELRRRDVKNPILIGNAFDPAIHRPMTPKEIGEDYERFDLVFVGTTERERFRSIERLAQAGLSVAVFGNSAGRLGPNWNMAAACNIVAGPVALGTEYTRKMHFGKVALCFLRKINRDLITTRSIEIPAMARPMLAEKTPEHDLHFVDGVEYVGFEDDQDLIETARELIFDEDRRRRVGENAYARCVSSGYSVDHRAREMCEAIEKIRQASSFSVV